MKVWADPEVIEKLEDLIDTLYEKGYFNFQFIFRIFFTKIQLFLYW